MAIEPRELTDYAPVLTTKDAARLLHLHEESLRVLARAGNLPCHRFLGGAKPAAAPSESRTRIEGTEQRAKTLAYHGWAAPNPRSVRPWTTS